MLPRRPVPVVREFRVVRGENTLGELEAIVGIGRGRFEDGVHVLARIHGGRASLLPFQGAHADPFPEASEKARWAVGIYAEDAQAMGGLRGGVSDKLSYLLSTGWRHLPEGARARARERVAVLTTGFGPAWAASGRARWWSPPSSPRGQSDVRVWFEEE